MHLFEELARRERNGEPVKVGLIGCGFFGGGLLRQLMLTKGIRPAAVATRTVQRAVRTLTAAGVAPGDLRVTRELDEAQRWIDRGGIVVTDVVSMPARLRGIDVVSDTTGDVAVGAETAMEAIAHRKHVVAANPEAQATVGAALGCHAREAGVVYSDVDGDQAGILMRMFEYYSALGFEPVAAVNCKGVMKRYATPETQRAFAEQNGIRPWIAAAAADGTKLNFEMCILSNATGMKPACTGMHGIQTTLDGALASFLEKGLVNPERPVVEYTLGIPSGVFIIARNERPAARAECRYLKMGDGPYYLFFTPYVLCHFEGAVSVAEAAVYRRPVISPAGAPVSEVAAFAKADLSAGRRLDGIGGFDCYGQIVEAEAFRADGLLPIGTAHAYRLTRDVAKDEPIPAAAVEPVEDCALTRLRKRQEEMFAPAATVKI